MRNGITAGTAGMCVFFLLVLRAAALAQASNLNPPGQMFDLGGRRLHLNCSGKGSPTVVVENGGGGFSVEWALVQPEIAKQTRICTYDRAGYAWSDAGPVVDGIEQIMDDLNLLLRKARIDPPYILVGASLGCIYSRAYQRRFPELLPDWCSLTELTTKALRSCGTANRFRSAFFQRTSFPPRTRSTVG